MAIKGRRVLIQEKTGTDTLVNIYPDTVAERVWYDEETSIKEKLDNEVKGLTSKIENLNTGVTGVKGDSETSYRTGQVNITKANIGLGNVVNQGMDATPKQNSESYVMSGGVYTAIKSTETNLSSKINDITAIAQGKTSTYVVDTTVSGNYANGQLNYDKTTGVQQTTLSKTLKLKTIDNSEVSLSDLKVGDIVLVTSKDKYDWWVGSVETTTIVLYTFEAEKVDLTDYATKTYADGVPTTNEYDFYTNIKKTVVDGIKDLYTISYTNSSRIDNTNGKIFNIEEGITAVGKANQLTNARNISLSGDATGSGSFDGSKDITITTTIGDGKITTEKLKNNSITSDKILAGTIVNSNISADAKISNSKLADSGVTAGTYSAVKVNAKGIVTEGANYIEYGTSSNNTPSENLVVGGLFFSFISEN